MSPFQITLILILVSIVDCKGLTDLRSQPYISRNITKASKIVSGSNANPHEFPFIVSLVWQSDGALLCGGNIYNELTIITAAHCVVKEAEPDFSIFNFIFTPAPKFVTVARTRLLVVAGEHHLFKDEGTEQYRNLAKIVVHPKYQGNREPYDVALLILDQPLEFNTYVKPIRLPPAGHIIPIGMGTAVGWGVDGKGRSTHVLRKAKVPILPEIICSASYSHFLIFSNICAGGAIQDTCYGDSGGPLLCDEPPLLCGLTSYGKGCGKILRPGAYTKVRYFASWILQNAGKVTTNFTQLATTESNLETTTNTYFLDQTLKTNQTSDFVNEV